jgi:hypothetical protein
MKTMEEVKNIYGLSDSDLDRLSVEGIKNLIKVDKERLSVWSISGHMKREIEEEIECLEVVLKYALEREVV